MYKYLIMTLSGFSILASCSQKDSSPVASSTNAATGKELRVGIGSEPPTLDPHLAGDTTSFRVLNDLFEGLLDYDQHGDPIPGLAESWEISPNQLSYTFHLRPNLRFSDNSPLTARDVVLSWRRLADPKTGAAQSNVLEAVVNGKAITEGKLPVEKLGVSAVDESTFKVELAYPKRHFLDLVMGTPFKVLSLKVIEANGAAWTDPYNMVSSGAYMLREHVVNGYILLEKNPYYYAAEQVKIPRVKFLPIIDQNAELNNYLAGNLDMTNTVPVEHYAEIKTQYPQELHTVGQEAIYFYDFNMLRPELKNNHKLRQALSMAIEREVLVNKVLGQGQTPLYSYVTPTVARGQYAAEIYYWAKLPRAEQMAMARKLFHEAGYNAEHPLKLTISYNTLDANRKVALAVADMWHKNLGVEATIQTQEWKSFIDARNHGDYQVARDGWIAGKNISDYTDFMLLCGVPTNNSHYCNPSFDKLIYAANHSRDEQLSLLYTKQALQTVMYDYPFIPLYQYTYFRLVKPYVHGYDPSVNPTDTVQSKWLYFK